MNDRESCAPVDETPAIELPRDLLLRMIANGASQAEFQIVLLVALISIDRNGSFQPISDKSLLAHPLLIEAGEKEGTPIPDETWPWSAIEAATANGSLLRFSAQNSFGKRTWSALNTIQNATFVHRLTSGQDEIPKQYWIDQTVPVIAVERPTIFRLYEQNIGPLTPMIAQRLIKAINMYPGEWIEAAIEESVTYNRRSWRYVSRILENWAVDGPARRT